MVPGVILYSDYFLEYLVVVPNSFSLRGLKQYTMFPKGIFSLSLLPRKTWHRQERVRQGMRKGLGLGK